MTDKEKLEKVRAEIERRKKEVKDQIVEFGTFESDRLGLYDDVEKYDDLLSFIDSMQKEPKECMYSKDNYTDGDRKVLCEGCEEECEFNKKEEPVNECKIIPKPIECYSTCEKCPYSKKSESVSEDLDFIATRNALAYVNNINRGESPWLDSDMELAYEDGMKAGANWQKQQLMAKAVDGIVHHHGKCKVASVYYNDPDNVPMAYYIPSEGVSEGDVVKIITIKED